MRILLVGDSMTIGSAGDFTWRYRMWQHLCRTYGGPFRLVGPRTALHDDSLQYGDPEFPEKARAHLAGWGEGWGHMVPLIKDVVRRHKADTLLVSLGLIDLGFYTNAEQTAGNVRRFIEEARAANPRVRIAAMPVIRNTRALNDPRFDAECAQFNVELAKAVADLSTSASPLLLASPPEDWTVDTDTYDGTHPSPSGEHRIAAAFADAMHQGWEVGEAYEAEVRAHAAF